MSDSSTQDKTEQPTQKKLDDAKKEGQIARSKELATAGLILISGSSLSWFAPSFSEYFSELFTIQMQLTREVTRDPQYMVVMFGEAIINMLKVLIPFILVLNLTTFLLGIMPGGLIFVLKNIQPKISKMNPISGLKRMVSKDTIIELIKSILKISLIGFTLYKVLSLHWHELAAMAQMPLLNVLNNAMYIMSITLSFMGAALLIVAAIDLPYQKWSMNKKLKMSKQEIKDEHKGAEGSPEIKQKIKQIQRQMSQKRIDSAVPTADFVIVNPTHYAVAVKYDAARSQAPFIVAKGVDTMALRIKKIAESHDLDIIEAPELTRAIYHSTQVDQEIPAQLYTAVAYILTHIMQLSAYRKGRGKQPNTLPNFEIPATLKR